MTPTPCSTRCSIHKDRASHVACRLCQSKHTRTTGETEVAIPLGVPPSVSPVARVPADRPVTRSGHLFQGETHR